MPITWQAEDTTEPIADTTIEGIANFQNYSTVSGCAATYNASTMVVAIAAGSVLHNGSVVTVAGNSVTLVSDATNPRWTWIGISSVGVATVISGTPAAAPAVPELGDYVCSQLVLVQAGLTIATNATAKLDKRVIYTPTKTVLTTTGDTLYASAANVPARLAIGSASQVLTVSGGIPAWVTVAAGGFTLAGSDTTDRTMTSATAADLVTITGLSIPATTPVMILISVRQSASPGLASAIGLKINSTTIVEANHNAGGLLIFSADNAVASGGVVITLQPRRTNYDRGLNGTYYSSSAFGGSTGVIPSPVVLSASMPVATITDIIIRGDSNGTGTLGVQGVYVYTLGV